MATETWVAGTLYATWAAVFGGEADSIVTGDAILSSVAINNTTAGDTHMDVSFAISSMTTLSPSVLGLYWYPLNQDGSTYGDGRFGSAAAGPPPGSYLLGQCGLVPSLTTTAQTGAFASLMLIEPKLRLPPWKGKLVLYNNSGGTLGSTVTIQAQTYKYQIA